MLLLINIDTTKLDLLYYFNVFYIQYEGDKSLDDSSSSNRFMCPQCSSTFSFKQGLNRHWKGVHGNSLETLAAPTCNKKGKVSHHQDRSPRFKCPFEECDNMFTTVLHLSSHCKSEHDTNLGKYLNYGHV